MLAAVRCCERRIARHNRMERPSGLGPESPLLRVGATYRSSTASCSGAMKRSLLNGGPLHQLRSYLVFAALNRLHDWRCDVDPPPRSPCHLLQHAVLLKDTDGLSGGGF